MTTIDPSVPEVDGWPFRSMSCNDSCPSLILLRHSNTFVLDKQYALFNISYVSIAVYFKFTQNVIAALHSILKHLA
jgi:hypothetical protein